MAKNAMALVFANTCDELMPELTEHRSMASVPFGGRYRIIDFYLSNLVNAGVRKVGIIPRANYRSLMDHIGSGRPWDLDRKTGGISFLPPFISSNSGAYKGHIDAITGVDGYLAKSSEDYVIICDADVVCNIDLSKVLKDHIEKKADVTAVYKHGKLPSSMGRPVFSFDKDGFANEILVLDEAEEAEEYCDFGIGIMIFEREQLRRLAKQANAKGERGIIRGILQPSLSQLKINGYRFDGFCEPIYSIESYTAANMALLKREVRNEIFNSERPIYTKTRDDMPTRYGLNCSTVNSIIGDGCIIEGCVENSILFRGVKVEKGAKVKNCIIMQETIIGANSNLQYITADKEVAISAGSTLRGAENNHYIIKKGGKI